MFVKSPYFLSRLTKKSISWKIYTSSKEIYLTFDDGPHPEITPWVLNLLDSKKIKATFFCVGDNVRKFPDTYNEIISRGYSTGNHTYNHISGWKTSNKDYYANIYKCKELVDSDLFRPPYGKIKPSQVYFLKNRNFRIILWTIISYDFENKISPEKCLDNVICNLKPGSIIVFHDSEKAKKNLYGALPEFIDYALNHGYEFKVL
ncbi:MAG: polysaccharide deacetylase family protein [Bacteroidota bacterium]|nr:polysaccharide deacetylase family protein [Bacteroidota bacterium]